MFTEANILFSKFQNCSSISHIETQKFRYRNPAQLSRNLFCPVEYFNLSHVVETELYRRRCWCHQWSFRRWRRRRVHLGRSTSWRLSPFHGGRRTRNED